MTMNNVIEIENLHKSFGKVHAVNDLSFKVKEGELFAFLGLNGAGKSTTISMICGLLKKDSGKITVNGVDIERGTDLVKSELGVVFQSSVLDKPLSVFDNLKTRAALYGIFGKDFEKRLSALSHGLGFEKLLDRPVGKLSGGERRRIDVARALLHEPKILILDEPTTGLDPQTRRTLWSFIDSLRAEKGMTVFLTTHYMEETADADYIIILDEGKIAAEGTPLELKNRYTGDFVTLYNVKEEQVASLGYEYQKIRDAFKVSVPDTETVVGLIKARPEVFSDFEVTKGRMDDVFLAVTGKSLSEGAGQ